MYIDDSGRIYDDCRRVNRTDDSQNRLSVSQDNGIVDFSSTTDNSISENNKMLFWVLSMGMCICIWTFVYFATDGCDGEPILVLGTLVGAIAATVYRGSLMCEYNLTSSLFAGGASVLGMIGALILITIVCLVIAVAMALVTFSISIVLSMLLIGLFSGS